MKRLDQDKPSFVEFHRSIKFGRQQGSARPTGEETPHFAHLEQRVRSPRNISTEESQLVRSAN